MQISIENGTYSDIGVDFRDYWGLFLPVQFVPSEEEQLTVISILTPIPTVLAEELVVDVLRAWGRGELVVIPAGETLDYYIDFN